MRWIARIILLALAPLVLTACRENHVCVPAVGFSETSNRRLWVNTYEQHCLVGRGTVDVSVDTGQGPTGPGNVFSAAVLRRRYRSEWLVNAHWADSVTLIVSYAAGLDVRQRADTMPGFRVVYKQMR